MDNHGSLCFHSWPKKKSILNLILLKIQLYFQYGAFVKVWPSFCKLKLENASSKER